MSNISLDYLHKSVDLLKKIEETQADVIEEVSQLFFRSISNNGLVHVYGSGHSRMGVEEMFPRYGSYPGFHPIVELSTSSYHQVVGANGLSQVMFLETVEGLAWHILRNFELKPQDSFLLFSTSGTGNVVIDMAMLAKERGVPVVAITGMENSLKAKSKHSTGKKLYEVADYVIDNLVPVGDAAMWIDGLKYPVGPMSTISNSVIVNMIKVRVAELLTEAGQPPVVITGSQVIGDEASKEAFDLTYEDYARRMKR
jgi:uncharacterized phosphosugar-binding protein